MLRCTGSRHGVQDILLLDVRPHHAAGVRDGLRAPHMAGRQRAAIHRHLCRIILGVVLVESFHSAYLMAFHAIGKMKMGNMVCGSLMILTLPAGYIALKMGLPPYSVFVIILANNVVCHVFSWVLTHRYVPFSYWQACHGGLSALHIGDPLRPACAGIRPCQYAARLASLSGFVAMQRAGLRPLHLYVWIQQGRERRTHLPRLAKDKE